MFSPLVGLIAIDVSLCGPTDASVQSVLALAVVCVPVVQIAVPVLTAGAVPNTAPSTGAGAPVTLCAKSMGCGLSSAATASDWPTAMTPIAAKSKSLSLTTTSLKGPAGSQNGSPPLNLRLRTCHKTARPRQYRVGQPTRSVIRRAWA